MRFEILTPKKHDRQAFDSGIVEFNIYLKQFAHQDQKRGYSRVYVLADGSQIIGYYAICAHSVPPDQLNDKKIGAYKEVPFLLLGRLAVDIRFRGKGYGHALIFHAFSTTIEIAEKIGVMGIIVDAKDENAANFYKKFGFQPLLASKNRLVLSFLAIKTLI